MNFLYKCKTCGHLVWCRSRVWEQWPDDKEFQHRIDDGDVCEHLQADWFNYEIIDWDCFEDGL